MRAVKGSQQSWVNCGVMSPFGWVWKSDAPRHHILNHLEQFHCTCQGMLQCLRQNTTMVKDGRRSGWNTVWPNFTYMYSPTYLLIYFFTYLFFLILSIFTFFTIILYAVISYVCIFLNVLDVYTFTLSLFLTFFFFVQNIELSWHDMLFINKSALPFLALPELNSPTQHDNITAKPRKDREMVGTERWRE